MLSAVRAASPHCRLALNAVHRVSTARDGPRIKTRVPDDVDVVLASDLVFTLSGVLNGVKLASDELLRSQLAQHLVDYFRANATELGIARVSSMYLDDDGLPKLKIVSSRCLTPASELRRVHVVLIGIDLNYVWHTNSESKSNSLVHPFSTHLSLPFKMLLDNVITRFFTWQLVRRYPLIFGPWCQQLDIERPYFDKMFRSISSIIARSPDPSFRKKCNRMLQTMQEQQSAAFTAAATSLANYFGSTADSHEIDDEDGEHPALTDEEAFSLSMEIRYRSCLRRPRFKGTTRAAQADDQSDEDELSQDQSILTPESSQRFDENYLWHHPPPVPSDFAFGFDLPLASANIERFSPLDMGVDKEYQDPAEFWSDLDDDEEEDDLLGLSSDNEANRGSTEPHFGMDLPFDDFSLVTLAPPSVCSDERVCELGLALDVNMDGTPHTSHAEGSPDAPQLQSTPTQIESPSAAEHLWRQATKEQAVPRLSSMHALDLELSFDSDSDAFELEESSDAHELEAFVYDVTASGTWPGGTLEHQAGLPNIATDVGVGCGVEHIGLDEDWEL